MSYFTPLSESLNRMNTIENDPMYGTFTAKPKPQSLQEAAAAEEEAAQNERDNPKWTAQQKAGVATGVITAAGTIAASYTNPDQVNKYQTRYGAVGGAAGSLIGGFFGPVGSQVGNLVGKVAGNAIGKNRDANYQTVDAMAQGRLMNSKFNPTFDGNMYGEQDAYFAEEGMMVPSGDMSQQSMTGQTPQVQPEMQMLNIEKDELLVDAEKLEIIQEFKNPNRYKAHSKNPFQETTGNFIQAPAGAVVIPKKYARSFKEGDKLTKQSIIKNILKDQKNDPGQNAPRTGVPMMRTGGIDPTNPPVDLSYRPENRFGPLGAPMPIINQAYDNTLMDPNETMFGPARVQSPVARPRAAAGALMPKKIQSPFAPQEAPEEEPQYAEDKRMNWNLIGAQAANFLPTAVGYINSGKGDPYLKHVDNGAAYSQAEAYVMGNQTKPSTQAAKAAVGNSLSRLEQMFGQYASPSVASNFANAYGQAIDRVGSIEEAAINKEMELNNQKRMQLAELGVQKGADWQRETQRIQNEKRMDQAAREDNQQSYLSEGVVNANQLVMDQERLRVANSMSNIFKTNPYMKQLIQEKPEVVNEFIIPTFLNGNALPYNTQATPTKKNIRTTRRNDRYGPNSERKGFNIQNSNTTIN